MNHKILELFSQIKTTNSFDLCFERSVADCIIHLQSQNFTINVMLRYEGGQLKINISDYEDLGYFIVPKYISLRDLSFEIKSLAENIQPLTQSTIDSIDNFVFKVASIIAIYQLS